MFVSLMCVHRDLYHGVWCGVPMGAKLGALLPRFVLGERTHVKRIVQNFATATPRFIRLPSNIRFRWESYAGHWETSAGHCLFTAFSSRQELIRIRQLHISPNSYASCLDFAKSVLPLMTHLQVLEFSFSFELNRKRILSTEQVLEVQEAVLSRLPLSLRTLHFEVPRYAASKSYDCLRQQLVPLSTLRELKLTCSLAGLANFPFSTHFKNSPSRQHCVRGRRG